MITRYGYDVFFTITALCVICAVIALVFIEPKVIRGSIFVLSVLLFAFTLHFFRDPDRTTPQGENLIVAPADGKIIAIKTVQESEFFKGEAKQICIFMSPLNVHVNRNPISGTVKHTRYVKGEYFAAFADKASERNEQMIVGIENEKGKVLFKQIAGFIARRIVCPLKEQENVIMGERFGMIKFGSRVDVFIPMSASVWVETGQTTRAGETVLAEFSDAQKGAQIR
jgi:phosphatidylserine decarboxylase